MISHFDDEDADTPAHSHARRTGSAHEQSRAPDKRRLMRDAGIAACVGVVAVVFYPQIAAFVFGPPPAPKKPLAVAEIVAPPVAPAEQRMAAVVRFARVRDEPSRSGSVVAGLAVGTEVAVLEARDKWLLVRFPNEDDKAEPRKGWVSASFLKDLPPVKTLPLVRTK